MDTGVEPRGPVIWVEENRNKQALADPDLNVTTKTPANSSETQSHPAAPKNNTII